MLIVDTTILDKFRLQYLQSYTGKDVQPDARYNLVPHHSHFPLPTLYYEGDFRTLLFFPWTFYSWPLD
ncbi:hypothetical protein TB1_042611 [Malus domestica]